MEEILRARRLALAREAMRLADSGKTLRAIGAMLGISHKTARTLVREGREASDARRRRFCVAEQAGGVGANPS